MSFSRIRSDSRFIPILLHVRNRFKPSKTLLSCGSNLISDEGRMRLLVASLYLHSNNSGNKRPADGKVTSKTLQPLALKIDWRKL